MRGLELYSKAKAALAAAVRVDEVRKIHATTVALAAYARIAKDSEMEANARELRERAERRLGEMMAKQPKAKGAREPGTKRGTTRDSQNPASLAEAGIDKNLANKARKAAAMSEPEFLRHIEDVREQITSPAPRPKRYVTAMVTERRRVPIVAPYTVVKNEPRNVVQFDPLERFEQSIRSAIQQALVHLPAQTVFGKVRTIVDELETGAAVAVGEV